MKILVTGYKGFIGSNMFNALAHRGHHVYGCEYEDFSPKLLENKDWVIHCGAISSTIVTDIKEVMCKNVLFVKMLREYCELLGVNIQFSSSASIYGPNNTSFNETDTHDARSLYAWSKVEGEKILVGNTIHGIITTQVFRYFNVYGNGEEHKEQPSPHSAFKKQAKEYGHIKVFENSNLYKRDFVPVSKIIDVQEKFLNINESGVWNIGTGVATSFLEVAERIAKENNVEVKEIPMPENIKKNYQAYTCADMTKTNETLKRFKNV